ncbi:hypothetical protein QQP08_009239 [Theobroma cacao]|nr:hypothetical protein QQP08_009239 [Theobroma cacao]
MNGNFKFSPSLLFYCRQAFRLYVLKHKRLSEYGIITKEIHSIQKINPFCGFIRESKWRGELREEKCQTQLASIRKLTYWFSISKQF